MPAIAHPYILDIEASGFGPHSYPIEVGVALRTDERFSTLIKPGLNWTHWDDQAEAIHRISRQTLAEHGKSVVEVVSALNQRLSGQVLYSDGWVVDKPWLTQLFHEARVPMQFQLSPIEQILNEHQMQLWSDVRQQVTIELNATRHRASQDAWVVQETWLRTRQMSDAEK